MWRGMYQETIRLLDGAHASADPDVTISILATEALALTRLHNFDDAERKLTDADRICARSAEAACGQVTRARGLLALEREQFSVAESELRQALLSAQAHHDLFLESTALLNLSAVALVQEHFDQAIERSQSALALASQLGARDIIQVALGNLGWAYYKLGDDQKAIGNFNEAMKTATELGDDLYRLRWQVTSGYVFLGNQDYSSAEQAYGNALTIARRIDSKGDVVNALLSLGLVNQKVGRFSEANRYSDEAIAMARADGNRLDVLYPLLVKGQVAAQLRDTAKAESIFREVANDPQSDSSLRWEAQHSLARLEENQNQRAAAARNYEAALCTFETARSSVHREESRLPFFTNAAHIYDDYIGFLIRSGQGRRALEVADYSRGRTLAEGLGYLKNDRPCSTPTLMAERVAASVNATILYYWQGQQQSYLWSITSRGVQDFVLPPAGEIEASVQRYREKLVNGEDVLASSSKDGLQLYQILVAPAAASLSINSRVIVIPDRGLTALNFETLLVPGKSSPHYWIEDAVISNAQSLRLLLAEKGSGTPRAGKMLLVGDAVPHPPEFPALPNASLEIQNIGKHFSTADLTTYTQSSATAGSFLGSKPELYSYIHFVAHAVASSQVPLDSAVILSPRPGDDSFKLYARDIIQHRLRARLVTVSACYGAGTRAYNGEGLIGLSWAFLRAGARNTIGALWEVNDISTPQLMDRFYAELKEGHSPDLALRNAKLSLMRSNKSFSKPFYWAPFQLYGNS